MPHSQGLSNNPYPESNQPESEMYDQEIKGRISIVKPEANCNA